MSRRRATPRPTPKPQEEPMTSPAPELMNLNPRTVVAPRCDAVNVLTGAACRALLLVQAGPGTIIDCPKCRKRHAW